MKTTRSALLGLLIPTGLLLSVSLSNGQAQQPSYPYNIQINQGQWPYYTSPYLHRTYENGIWVYPYYPPNTSDNAPSSSVRPAPQAQAAPARQTASL